jgi:hypothetical protein
MNVRELALSKGFTEELLKSYGVRDVKRFEKNQVEIPYFNADGTAHQRYQIRMSEKSDWFWNKTEPDNTPLFVPYGLHRPVPYDQKYTWIVEGASDCWTLWSSGFPALGIPGAKNTARLKAEYVNGADFVVVSQEPGEAGEQFPSRVAAALYSDGYTGRVYAVPFPEECKDPRALWFSDKENFRENLRKLASQKKVVKRITPTPIPTPTEPVFLTLRERLEKPRVNMDWLVEGFLPHGGLMLMAAMPKAGKTILARNIALGVCAGGKFLGRKCSQGTVLWLGLEEPEDEAIKVEEAMGFLDLPFHSIYEQAPADAMGWLERSVEKFNPSLIVIDTWHSLTLIENINDYAAVNRANIPLQALARQRGIAQIWIHHNKKPDKKAGSNMAGSDVLGSTALFAAVDTLMTVECAADDVHTAWTKQRFGGNMQPTVLTMNEVNYLIGDDGDEYHHRVKALGVSILDIMRDADGPMVRNDICDLIGKRRQLTLAAIGRLVADGLIRKLPSEKREPERYILTNCEIVASSSSQVPKFPSSRSSQRFPRVPLKFPNPRNLKICSHTPAIS